MKLFFLKLKDRFGGNWIFLFTILIMYLIIGFFNSDYFLLVGKEVYDIFIKQILGVLIIVFIFMFILNLLLEKEKVKQLLKNSNNFTKYIFSIIGGMFSTGPVYMWYPFLKQLKNNGLHYGHIASFIYARAIKLPFITVMILYFGLKYTIIFDFVLLFLSFILGLFISLFLTKTNITK